jgi:hypothetical protein
MLQPFKYLCESTTHWFARLTASANPNRKVNTFNPAKLHGRFDVLSAALKCIYAQTDVYNFQYFPCSETLLLLHLCVWKRERESSWNVVYETEHINNFCISLSKCPETRTRFIVFIFKFASEYVTRNDQHEQKGLEFNGTHHFLIMSVCWVKKREQNAIKKTTHSSKKVGAHVNANRMEYAICSWLVTRMHDKTQYKDSNKSLKNVAIFEYYWMKVR